MKIFLSWSGERSKAVATAFDWFIPRVFQGVSTYISSEDIEKGARWSSDVAGQLEGCSIGLLFLTGDNLQAPWIMFEAGALSKKLDNSRVCPILLGIENTDLKGPLTQFQATSFNRIDINKLLNTINNALRSANEKALDNETLTETFDLWWPRLEERVTTILSSTPHENVKPRDNREMIEETLTLVRSLASNASNRSTSASRLSERAVMDLLETINELVKILPYSEEYPNYASTLRALVQIGQYIGEQSLPLSTLTTIRLTMPPLPTRSRAELQEITEGDTTNSNIKPEPSRSGHLIRKTTPRSPLGTQTRGNPSGE